MKTILTVFAKLNPGIRYVQGMNEIVAPLFYVFKNDLDEKNAVSTFFFLYFFYHGVNDLQKLIFELIKSRGRFIDDAGFS